MINFGELCSTDRARLQLSAEVSKSTKLIRRSVAGALFATCSFWGTTAAADFRICNQSAVELSAIAGFYDNGWVAKGWYNLDPGECATPYTGNANSKNFYIYAHSNSELTRWLNGSNTHWSGREGVFCPPRERFQKRFTLSSSDTKCHAAKAKMLKVEASSRNYTFSLTDRASPARNLQEAAQWHTIFQDRMEFEKARGTKPQYPFSIGVSVERDSLIVDRVYAGLPAHWVGIEAGDKIYSVGAKRVHSLSDFAKEINRLGMRYDHDISVQVTVVRNDELLKADVPLEYTYYLDPRRTSSEATEATLRAGADSIALGFGSTAYCFAGGLIGDALDWGINGDDSFERVARTGRCAAADQAGLDRLKRMYPDEYGWGDIAGAFVGSFRAVAKGWLKLGGKRATLLGSSSLARLAENMLLEGVEGALTAVGQANTDASSDQVFQDAVAAGSLGLGIGAVTSVFN